MDTPLAKARLEATQGSGPVRVDVTSHQIWVRGQEIALAGKELALIEALAWASGYLSNEEIKAASWSERGTNPVGPEEVRRLVDRTRLKMERGGDPRIRYLVNVLHKGYRLEGLRAIFAYDPYALE